MQTDITILHGDNFRWQLFNEIGRGRFGTVTLGTDDAGRKAAIKCLHSEFAQDEIVLLRLLRELTALSEIEHPAFPKLLDQGLTQERVPFYAMEFLDGETLDAYRLNQGGTVDLDFVLSVADQVLDGLGYAHELGWQHRDLSPRNLLITDKKEAKILDFGLCRAIELSGALASITGPGQLGTPGFISPEQARNDWANVGASSDLWSLGATLLFLMRGQHIHSEPRTCDARAAALDPVRFVQDVLPEIPIGIAAWVGRALEHAPDRRWRSAREMRAALGECRTRDGHTSSVIARAIPSGLQLQVCSSTAVRTPDAELNEPHQLALQLVHSPDSSSPRRFRLGSNSVFTIGRGFQENGWTISDPLISRLHATIQWSEESETYRIVDRASRNGVEVNGRRCNVVQLKVGDVIRLGESLIVLVDESAQAQYERKFATAAAHSSHILLTGETGAGKEYVAREIHRRSGRTGAFVTVDCAALGQEGAVRWVFGPSPANAAEARETETGLIGAARGGSLFLNEIGDMPLPVQSLLSRALRRNSIRPPGTGSKRELDVRVIATATSSLEEAISAGAFRLDLHSSIAETTLHVPALRERRHEILEIFDSLASAKHLPLRIAVNAAEALLLWSWPANVCGLKQLIAQLVTQSPSSDELDLPVLKHLQPELSAHLTAQKNASIRPSVRVTMGRETLREKPSLEGLLAKYKGNVTRAAKDLHVTRTEIYRSMKKLGIKVDLLRNSG